MKIFKKSLLVLALILTFCTCSIILFSCQRSNKLKIVQSFKTTYYVGEQLNVKGGILQYVDDGKEVNVALQEHMVSAFSTDKPGTRKLIITYLDWTLLVDYTVNPYDVQDNVYYKAENQEYIQTYIIFNKSANSVSILNAKDEPPSDIPESQRVTYTLTKSYDEDGFILYTTDALSGGLDFTSKITFYDITKDSIKMEMTAEGQLADVTLFTIYNN